MRYKISLKEQTEISENSKMCADDSTENKVGADTNKKLTIRAEKLGDNNSSAQGVDVKKLLQRLKHRVNNALALVNNKAKEVDEHKSEQRSEQSPAKRNNRKKQTSQQRKR